MTPGGLVSEVMAGQSAIKSPVSGSGRAREAAEGRDPDRWVLDRCAKVRFPLLTSTLT